MAGSDASTGIVSWRGWGARANFSTDDEALSPQLRFLEVDQRILIMATLVLVGCSELEEKALQAPLAAQNLRLPVRKASSPAELSQAVEEAGTLLILASEEADPLSVSDVLKQARGKAVPCVVLGKRAGQAAAEAWWAAGAEDYLGPEELWRVGPIVRRALETAAWKAKERRSGRREQQMLRLLTAVQDLSLARDVPAIQAIVRRAARDLTGADGATFVLKDADKCYYADEDAIGPLWKGQRFPLTACISGWVMANKEPVVIEDIFNDARVPIEAYRPTFVKSLAMVPIRTKDPIGAIGNYWAQRRRAEPEEIEMLQALANTTAVAMENVQVYAELENRVKDRTRLLEQTNRELETFSYSVSHDLRSPITAIMGFAQLLSETAGEGSVEEVRNFCDRIIHHAHRMSGLIRDLLRLAKVAQTELKFQSVDLSEIASQTLARLKEGDQTRTVRTVVSGNLTAQADPELAGIVMDNLLSNAWKYTSKKEEAVIEFGGKSDPQNGFVFFVRDNGAGFDPRSATRLFAPFQRLHDDKQFAGVGVGLATVQRIVHKHGGRIWAEGAVDEGATFYFTLPESAPALDCSRAA